MGQKYIQAKKVFFRRGGYSSLSCYPADFSSCRHSYVSDQLLNRFRGPAQHRLLPADDYGPLYQVRVLNH